MTNSAPTTFDTSRIVTPADIIRDGKIDKTADFGIDEHLALIADIEAWGVWDSKWTYTYGFIKVWTPIMELHLSDTQLDNLAAYFTSLASFDAQLDSLAAYFTSEASFDAQLDHRAAFDFFADPTFADSFVSQRIDASHTLFFLLHSLLDRSNPSHDRLASSGRLARAYLGMPPLTEAEKAEQEKERKEQEKERKERLQRESDRRSKERRQAEKRRKRTPWIIFGLIPAAATFMSVAFLPLLVETVKALKFLTALVF
jgi:hypothetical protein